MGLFQDERLEVRIGHFMPSVTLGEVQSFHSGSPSENHRDTFSLLPRNHPKGRYRPFPIAASHDQKSRLLRKYAAQIAFS